MANPAEGPRIAQQPRRRWFLTWDEVIQREVEVDRDWGGAFKTWLSSIAICAVPAAVLAAFGQWRFAAPLMISVTLSATGSLVTRAVVLRKRRRRSPATTVARGGRTNTYAVISLVAGLLTPISFVLGAFAGVIALVQINETREKGKAFAVVGLVANGLWVVVIIIAIALKW